MNSHMRIYYNLYHFYLLFCLELPEDFQKYENATNKYHEAGYDAYVTGTNFATMVNLLGEEFLTFKIFKS